ncbi:MAG: replication-relaxation family protein [Phycisphaeraceae bacterium]
MDKEHSRSTRAGIIDALQDYQCLTDEQLASVTDRRKATVRKQIACLAEEGLVRRVSHPRRSRGRPVAVTSLPDSGWDRSHSREHQVQLNDIRIAFGHTPDTRFLIRTWDTQRVAIDNEAKDMVRPDAIALIEHEQATRPLVVFIELDRGTESFSRSNSSQSSWAAKAGRYQKLEHLVLWRDWVLGQVGLSTEAVCRLAVVTTTAARLARIDDTLQQTVPAVGVWLTRYNDVIKNGAWGKIWRCSEETGQRGFISVS